MQFGNSVKFEGHRLFSGAIDLDWLFSDLDKAKDVAASYVFHGSQYHAANNLDDKVVSGHKLTDSISMVEEVLFALSGENNNMLLAIAGFGAGKSHFALTLSTLLSSVDLNVRNTILSRIIGIDATKGKEILGLLQQDSRPFLVIPVNGMRNANLKDIFFSNINLILDRYNISRRCLYDFDPRFKAIKGFLLSNNNTAIVDKILKDCGIADRNEFADYMDNFDESVYFNVLSMIKKNGLDYYPPASIGELKDIIISVSSSLCGDIGKPFRGMLIVFDEFGKYMSFAANNEAVAGSGIMQQLFEGIQGSEESSHVVLLGLSQLDLIEYQRGTGNLAFSNNMNRYVTRFDAAKRCYLSVCFESLVANLIVKEPIRLLNDNNESSPALIRMKKSINTFFKSSLDNQIWSDSTQFVNTVFRGCWPLSPLAVWTLSYITSANNILQQRSGFNILSKLFADYDGREINEDFFPIKPVELYDRGLGDEFYNSEQTFKSADPIAQEYRYLLDRYKSQLSDNELTVLKSIVLSNKLSSVCSNENEARLLLELLSGLTKKAIIFAIDNLTGKFNALSFNRITNRYEIHSNAVSISEFRKIISDKVHDFRLSHSESELFEKVAEVIERSPDSVNIRQDIFTRIEPSFASDHNINSIEWGYESRIISGYEYVEKICSVIDLLIADNPVKFYSQKGRVIYAIIPSSISLSEAKEEVKKVLYGFSEKIGHIIPVMCLLLHDEDNTILNSSLEISVIDELSNNDQEKYSTLLPKRKDELFKIIDGKLQEMKLQRNYIYPIETEKPLRRAGSEIFDVIYPNIIPFEIDGFSSESGNGGVSVADFVAVLAHGIPKWSDFVNLGTKDSNRASSLLNLCWGCFEKKRGSLLKYPANEVISNFFHQLDAELEEKKELDVYNIFETLIKPPYGCNSTQSTLIVFIYLSYRSGGIDYKDKNDETINIDSFVKDKNAFEPRTKALTKSKWKGIRAVVSIRDDAKWYTLLNDWSDEKTYKGLILYTIEAEKLRDSNISIPTAALDQYQKCRNKSDKAIQEYTKWSERKSSLTERFNTLCDGEKVGRPLAVLCEYVNLYRGTIGRGEFECSEEEKADYEGVCSFVTGYIEENYTKWIDAHPSTGIIAQKNQFDDLKKTYEVFAQNLDVVGLDDEAIEIRNLIKECGDRRHAYSVYLKCYSEIKQSYLTLAELIDEGLYAYSQVDAYRKRITDILDKINEFPTETLKKIPGYNFDNLINKVDNLNNLVSNKIKEIDSNFENLLNYEISSDKDLSIIEDMATPIINFYSGSGKSKSDNLADAVLARTEVVLLKQAYKELSDATLSYTDLLKCVNKWKEKIYSELDGDSIYPDDDVLDVFYSEKVADLKNKSSLWIKKQESAYSNASSLGDLMKIQQDLLVFPSYLTEEDSKSAEMVLQNVNDAISDKRVDYIFELYNQLISSDKEKFRNLL